METSIPRCSLVMEPKYITSCLSQKCEVFALRLNVNDLENTGAKLLFLAHFQTYFKLKKAQKVHNGHN